MDARFTASQRMSGKYVLIMHTFESVSACEIVYIWI